MGIFSSPFKRNAYVPPSEASKSPTLLTGGDPNLMRVSGDTDAEVANDDLYLAQQKPGNKQSPPLRDSRAPVTKPNSSILTQGQLMTRPGRGYGVVPQDVIEKGMSQEQKSISRSQALREIAGQRPSAGAISEPLADKWQQEKPSEFVDAVRRAAQRHNVPTDVLARQMYQEGKFNEHGGLKSAWDRAADTPVL